MALKEVSNKPDFVQLEKEMLNYWQSSDAFNKLRQLRKNSKEHWSFLDGPITANNPMGVHHAWGRTYKDLYNRYQAMLGKELRWQQGFDCQGLWVEVNVEKELGFRSKRDIEQYGLAEFIKLCKQRVLRYAAVQTHQSIRLGYWMDWNNLEDLEALREALETPHLEVTIRGANGQPITGRAEAVVGQLGLPQVGGSYFTFSDENNYQIWRFLKECFNREWVYKGRDVMPWCARCGTGISQHEIVTDGYKEITHESVFVRFPLTGRAQEALLVWTTTPWTLTSNVAAAVGAELTYAQVKANDGWTYYLAKETIKNTLLGKEGRDYDIVGELMGKELVGWQYSGPFDDLPAAQAGLAGYTHRVVSWKDVGAAEGTGIVHIAPGCGAEDFGLSKEENLPIIAPLDENGVYVDGFGWLSGRSVHDNVAAEIFENLAGKGVLYRKQKYSHRYPHCWRCGEELVYRLVDEWFISMGEYYDKSREDVTPAEKTKSLRYQIMDRVDQANWFPGFGYDREMDWLRNMHDWMISKKRYWGLALPIWEFPDGSFYVVGSREELQQLAVEGWETFDGHTPHRPYIDAVKIRHPQTGEIGTRIKDVGNPWLDAGIVAFSTMHYTADQEYWQKWYPADLITESFPGQFRNWFYSLLAQSTVLSDKPPFKNLFGYATLLAEDGREMHKSWGNSIEFNEAADTMGADTMRWLYASCKPDKNLRFGYNVGDETRRRFLIPLWNVYSFFTNYAALDQWQPSGQQVVSPVEGNAQMDKWIVGRLHETIGAVRLALNVYDSEKATQHAEQLLDDLSNWYIRRSRRRFWKNEADADKGAAYATLYQVLVEFIKLLAPFIPFTTEAMYQNLVRGVDASAPESVHHCLYPEVNPAVLDQRLLDKMRLAITTAALGRAARSSVDMKLRQPLSKARVNVGTAQEQEDLMELAEVIAEEMNVKAVEVVSEVGELVNYKLLPNNPVVGPKFGKQFPQVRQALAQIDPVQGAKTLQAGQPLPIQVNGETVHLSSEDVLIQTEARGTAAVASEKGVTVAVDTLLTPELIQEGFARDVVRNINNLRKDGGLEISDRIQLTYQASGEVASAFQNFADYIKQETLAVVLTAGVPAGGQRFKVGEDEVVVSLQKVA